MDYFRLRQNRQYLHPPRIQNVQDIVSRRLDVNLQNTEKLKDVNVAFSKVEKVDFLDVLDEQLFLISEDVKQVFLMYEPALICKNVCLVNYETDEYKRYFLPIFETVDCISEKSIISPDKSSVQKLILKELPENKCIFKVAEMLTDIVIIRLDVVESLLRRDINRLSLERIIVDRSAELRGSEYGK